MTIASQDATLRVRVNAGVDGSRFDFEGRNRTTALFIQSPYAQGVAGVFAFLAIFLTVHQIYKHLQHYNRPNEQRYVVRILFIVPIYGLASWLSLLAYKDYIYFDTIRDCYEAFVIYNFLSLCFEYLGGDKKILDAIEGKPLKRSCWAGTCCLPAKTYSPNFLRFCKQATLQFCFIKPVVAFVTIFLASHRKYADGDWRADRGYLYQTIVYNFSISLALYALVLFYYATRSLLKPYDPVLKFIVVKFIIFMSFWQGVGLAIAEQFDFIRSVKDSEGEVRAGVVAKGVQNFLICIEMLLAAVMLRRAFPHRIYVVDLSKHVPSIRSWGMPLEIGALSNFGDTINPRDIMSDAWHNFVPRYKHYVRSSTDDHDARTTQETKASQPVRSKEHESSQGTSYTGIIIETEDSAGDEDKSTEQTTLLVPDNGR